MTIRHNFIDFADLRGCLEFDNDYYYDNCQGWIRLIKAPGADGVIMYEPFFSPAERDEKMALAFREAAKVMDSWRNAQKGI